jgi:hypothetical protein
MLYFITIVTCVAMDSLAPQRRTRKMQRLHALTTKSVACLACQTLVVTLALFTIPPRSSSKADIFLGVQCNLTGASWCSWCENLEAGQPGNEENGTGCVAGWPGPTFWYGECNAPGTWNDNCLLFMWDCGERQTCTPPFVTVGYCDTKKVCN